MYRHDKDFRKMRNKIEGAGGEMMATSFLEDKNYKILEMNYSNVVGEIDIIAQNKKVIVFVEVKRRASNKYGRPAEAVDARKQRKIRKMAEMYLASKGKDLADVRFDVVEILDDEITHIENAF